MDYLAIGLHFSNSKIVSRDGDFINRVRRNINKSDGNCIYFSVLHSSA